MARLLPILLLTAFAVYVVWADATSQEPVSELNWLIDAVIVGLALWSWIGFLRRKTPER
jgi:cell shape-determining protein MreD